MPFKCTNTLENEWMVKVALCQLFLSRGQFSRVMYLTDESSVVKCQALSSVLSMWCDVLDDWARVNTLLCKVRGLTNNLIMWHWLKAKHNQLKVIHLLCSLISIISWAFVRNHFSIKHASVVSLFSLHHCFEDESCCGL